jgi:hypothetical protein
MSGSVRRKKRLVGAVAIVLLLFFTVLGLLQQIDPILWVIADLIVAAIANLILRRLGR